MTLSTLGPAGPEAPPFSGFCPFLGGSELLSPRGWLRFSFTLHLPREPAEGARTGSVHACPSGGRGPFRTSHGGGTCRRVPGGASEQRAAGHQVSPRPRWPSLWGRGLGPGPMATCPSAEGAQTVIRETSEFYPRTPRPRAFAPLRRTAQGALRLTSGARDGSQQHYDLTNQFYRNRIRFQ